MTSATQTAFAPLPWLELGLEPSTSQGRLLSLSSECPDFVIWS